MTSSGCATCSNSAREACFFVGGRQRPDLDRDRQLVLALVKAIEIVGEAAAGVSAETRARIPEIPWVDIVGMRNRLIHAYFDIDLDTVWDTVRDDLPPLEFQLSNVIAAQSPEESA